ncbi:unnamed protein product [Nyctereutes procyonoides]|uniref:Nucleophosmin n=1 Tax=Nyctereutes procyonoides TaxID=34880 RepID=A0A811YT90_NYCPR|nr:unnamed protein product [Nyctereutes procyonoides]
MVSLGAKDELHIVEAEAMTYEGMSFGGFEITTSVVFRLKCGSGPVHISGQHLVAVEEDAESEDEEEEDVRLLNISGKRSAPGNVDEDDDDDDFDDEETEEKAPVKKSIRHTPAKNAQKSNQHGKDSKPSTPRSKGQESFKEQEKTPKNTERTYIEKGGSLPKVEATFINYVKNCFWMTDREAIQDLWQWRKSL